ncbi:MAG: hypothetical protein IJG38_07605 [Thermoguttaceae bacterium]|nr:hypothetical protein [Thermoguttaceae bacterium]
MEEKRLLGCIPSYLQEAEARSVGVKSDKELIESLVAPWNLTEQPRIIEWSDKWVEFLKEEANAKDLMRKYNRYPYPWVICKRVLGITLAELVGIIQRCNDCAAWATSRAAMILALLQRWFGAERTVEAYNPTGIYAFSSGTTPQAGAYFADNGRTIYAICKAACEVGNFPVADIGDYVGGTSFTQQMIDARQTAEKNQTGFVYVGDRSANELADIVILSLRAGRPVIIGNEIALQDGVRKDANGMYITTVNGSGWGGGHATCAIDYRKVNDTEYVYIANSHGNIYNSGTDIPAFGVYITRASLVKYLSGRFADIMPLTYTERPVGKENFDLNTDGGREK